MVTVNEATVRALAEAFDAVLFDVGGTLVVEAPAGTAVSALEARALPRAVETLRALEGKVGLGAVTDTAVMRSADVRSLLEPTGMADLLTVIVTSSDVGAAKPDAAPVLEALRRLGVAPHRALLVGDRAVDGGAALAAGAAFAATDRGVDDALARAMLARRGAFADARARIRSVDDGAMGRARERHARLTKPAGSLGRLEDVGVHLAGIAGTCPPPIPRSPAVAVFAADHGVVASGVTPWPQAVTGLMVQNFVAGGAAINAVARQVGAAIRVVDVGVVTDLHDLAGIEHRRIRAGTDDLARGPAMSSADAVAALDAGAEVASDLVRDGHDLLATGDMGIGNTTPSAALIARFTGRPAVDVTGRGTGIDDAMLAHKTTVVAAAVERTATYLDPVSVLSDVGGLEIAALAGFVTGGAAAGVPVVVDGVIALAALVVAHALVPAVVGRCLAGHRSTEPGAGVALAHLGLDPLLDLGLRLGEGTGAGLAIPIVQAAARILGEMATFEDAGI
jgi:nicotinate-nucleotide--dimethylbenzimidazole phosphoribosyltransferase